MCSSDLPLATSLLSQFNIPVYPTPERAARSLAILRTVSAPQEISNRALFPQVSQPSEGASEVEIKGLWQSVGIPVPESFVVKEKSEVKNAVAKVGGRSVLKAVIPGLLHKSDAGGVALDVRSEECEKVFDSMIAIAQEIGRAHV